jgi:hypothetical protein
MLSVLRMFSVEDQKGITSSSGFLSAIIDLHPFRITNNQYLCCSKYNKYECNAPLDVTF